MQNGTWISQSQKKNQGFFKESAYDYVKRAIANMAKSLGVSEECIRTISKEEYEENTEY